MLVIEPGRERQTGANRQETELLHIVLFVGGFSLFYFLKKKINKSLLRIICSEVKVSTAGLKIAKFTSFI